MGNASGNIWLDIYQYEIGVKKDYDKAFEYYQKSEIWVMLLYNSYKCSKSNSETVEYDCASKRSNVYEDLKDMLIKNKYHLPWIPYNDFTGIKEIGKGEFATVYHAHWDDNSSDSSCRCRT
ncbi:hypothetical protein C2G38_2026548 [Gigaspora rosea]|uniref:Protein kinase domain-containing protein n=1 Tax=Gigaspora rosea TaxID=44941 RepID=A0A397WAF3_9GLOM|nr:hypothetical protein C2G38_2026548 [Gigaspora rosea]